jgi:hypothetical protein
MNEEATRPEARPVGETLIDEGVDEARRKGVVVWLDRHGHYVDLVDWLVEEDDGETCPHPIVRFRGSYLETMLELEGHLEGHEPHPLIVHVPDHNQKSIKETPLFGLFEAGKRWRRALDTLVEEAAAGHVPSDEIRAFLDDRGDELTLEEADRWLEGQLAESSDGTSDVLGSIDAATHVTSLLDGEEVTGEATLAEMRDHLRAVLGMSSGWNDDLDVGAEADGGRPSESTGGGDDASRRRRLGRAAATWVLAVEFVDDLRRDPVAERLEPLADLPDALVETCREVAEHLRDHRGDVYARLARDFQPRLRSEWEAARAEDLGDIDTYPIEEQTIFEAALDALEEERWHDAHQWAEARDVSNCFWVRRDRDRQHRWTLIGAAARLGQQLEAHDRPFEWATSPEEAARQYADDLWNVDRAHRHLEQRRHALLRPRLADFVDLRDVLDGLRRAHRDWADRAARRFNTLCQQHGVLPASGMRQREIFDDVVDPLVDDRATTALVVVDGLRFEMAEQLRDALADDNDGSIHLEARLAELPTRTAVGMNVLPPVAEEGRLEPVFGSNGRITAFQTHQFQVRDDDSRRKTMRHAVGGRACPGMSIDEILEGTEDLTRKIQNASLVVVHSGDIDAAGEKGHGLATFERTLTDIRGAIRLLRQAGIDHVVITADHGFLLQDETTAQRLDEGKKTHPQDRYALYPEPEEDGDRLSISMRQLDYEVDDEAPEFIVPRDTSLFDTGGSTPTYVHGGNSPQERIVPVLTLSAGTPGGATRQFEIEAETLAPVTDLQRLRVTVDVDQTALGFGGPESVELALRAPEDPEVDLEIQSVPDVGDLQGGTFQAPLDESIEVFFRARGPVERRIPVEVYAPTMMEAVEPTRPEGRIAVQSTTRPGLEKEGEPETGGSDDSSSIGLEDLPDDGTRDVFEYLAEYGDISEADATELLGGATAFRRFSRRFEDYLDKVSFDVQVTTVDFQKHYERTTEV